MKLSFLVITLSLVSNVFASSKTCEVKAEKAVAKSVPKNYYDVDGFNSFNCSLAPNKAVVICEVSASKGGGEAVDTFRVVMNATCSKVFRVELIGEE